MPDVGPAVGTFIGRRLSRSWRRSAPSFGAVAGCAARAVIRKLSAIDFKESTADAVKLVAVLLPVSLPEVTRLVAALSFGHDVSAHFRPIAVVGEHLSRVAPKSPQWRRWGTRMDRLLCGDTGPKQAASPSRVACCCGEWARRPMHPIATSAFGPGAGDRFRPSGRDGRVQFRPKRTARNGFVR
jgi:hypothetical protein